MIPKEIGLLTLLKYCGLSHNQLSGLLGITSDVHIYCILIGTGSIPRRLATYKSWKNYCSNPTNWKVRKLDSISNVHNKCIVVGQGDIPEEVGSLKVLTDMNLSRNQLTGKKGGYFQ
jgi:hypothetical protein